MKIEWSPHPLGALHLKVVPAGTVVTDERSGKSITVTDTAAAVKGAVMWCTQAVADRIAARAKTVGNG